jgi:pimeloyl-ACP methyl ester carboxylesterase
MRESELMAMHVDLDGVEVDYEVIGTGEQIAFLHARPFVSWYSPLVERLSSYSVLRYQRTPPSHRSRFGIDDDAAFCARLLNHVGFDHAHLVGHSYGGLLALALACRDDLRPRSIALLEPASSGLLSPEEATAGLAPLMDAYRSQGPEVAMDQFLRAVCGDDYRELLDRLVPEAFADAMAHADQFFRVELDAVAAWNFGPHDAERIDVPVLNVVGADSAARFVHGANIVQTWLPHSLRYELPGTGHLMMAQNPGPIAERLEQFWSDS